MNKSMKEHFQKGIRNVFRLDKKRIVTLLGTLQYSLIYIVTTLFFAYLIDHVFFDFEEENLKKKSKLEIIISITIQLLINVFCVFYIRKLVDAVPFFLNHPPYGNYNYSSQELNGEIIIGFVFIGAQLNLLKKISYVVEEQTSLS